MAPRGTQKTAADLAGVVLDRTTKIRCDASKDRGKAWEFCATAHEMTHYVDPDLINNRDAKFAHTITLSYTFHETDLPEGYAALDQQADS